MTLLELEKIENHVLNIPSVAALYVPQLTKAVREARDERDEAIEALENLEGVIRDNIPYHYDQGEADEDEANPEECVEYAAADIAKLKAEVEKLRGVGCGESWQIAGEEPTQDGPCGACLKCARRERDEAREAFHEATRLRSLIQQARIKAEQERDEARAEVERMRGIEAKLRAALEQIAFPRTIGSAFHEEAVAIARRVL